MPICTEQIKISIVIVIQKERTKTDKRQCRLFQSTIRRRVGKKQAFLILIKGRFLGIRDDEIEPSITVVIPTVYTHRTFSDPFLIITDTDEQAFIRESAIAVVMIQEVAVGIVGDVNIWKPVIIVVTDNSCHAPPFSRVCYTCCRRNIRKSAITVVLVEYIGGAFITARMPVTDNPLKSCDRHRQFVYQVVDDKNIQITIYVEIEIDGCDTPEIVINTGNFSDICKSAVPIISVECVLPKVCDIEIGITIIINIACSGCHPVTCVPCPRNFGNVRKTSISIVAIKHVSESCLLWVLLRLRNIATVHKIEVNIAIGVVIKKDNTGPHRLNDMLMLGFTVTVFEVDACCFGDIHEDRRLRSGTAYKGN